MYCLIQYFVVQERNSNAIALKAVKLQSFELMRVSVQGKKWFVGSGSFLIRDLLIFAAVRNKTERTKWERTEDA